MRHIRKAVERSNFEKIQTVDCVSRHFFYILQLKDKRWYPL